MDAELKKLGIYSLVLVGIAVIATSAIFLVTYYLCDKDQLSNVLGVMGAIGSILSGIAAIIASAAALIAVKSWLKQLKVGKYLTCIWEAKVALSKLEVRFGRWHAKKYDSRDKGDENVDLLYQELEDSFLDLENASHLLGSIVTKKKGVLKDVCKGAWVVEAQALQRECGKLKEYFESRPKQDTANIFSSSIESSKSLTDNIFILFDEFSKNIDELEKKYN